MVSLNTNHVETKTVDIISPRVSEVEVESETEKVVTLEDQTYTTNFRVTAYCSCEKCCGVWAKRRPKDEYGNQIVVGSSGVELVGGISCASPLPFGTKVKLDGYGVVEVQDRTADWIVSKYGDNVIDIYFDNHNKALEFGVKYLDGEVIK